MSDQSNHIKFIAEAKAIVTDHLSDENFGVSELAEQMHMSRSNLLRKIKKHTQLSASQFIREIRLQKGMQLLKETELTVSEISYQVGFSNNSYFTKCFREYYKCSPGEARENPDIDQTEEKTIEDLDVKTTKTPFLFQYRFFGLAIGLVAIVVFILYFYNSSSKSVVADNTKLDKSIAVLPFKNMSIDTTNLYFVNGLMESSLNNLQRIEDLRVISRTSVEKYRNTKKSASEIANDLNVNYLVEGSGQRHNNQVLLNIQLIEASKDTPIWAEQYNYEIDDIFQLQNTIAKKIAEAIQAEITPEELVQIEKKPTNNLEAYELYLKGLEKIKIETSKGLQEGITLFKKAVELDTEFALAYAEIAFAYFYLDVYKTDKKYTKDLNYYADKALLYDSKSAESLMAKALYYISVDEYKYAIPHLDKALEYNPNSSAVIQFLSDIYNRIVPDQNIRETTQKLVKEWKKDTNRLDILQEVGKFYYMQEKYDTAFYYYSKFDKARVENNLTYYVQENLKIGIVYEKMGLEDKAQELFNSFSDYAHNDTSIYKSASLATLYAHQGKQDQAIEQLKEFSTQDNFQYWIVLFIEKDPIYTSLKKQGHIKKLGRKIIFVEKS